MLSCKWIPDQIFLKIQTHHEYKESMTPKCNFKFWIRKLKKPKL